MADTMKSKQVSIAISEASSGNSEWAVTYGLDQQLHIRFRKVEASDCLVVHFHGAVDRTKRTPPVFQPFQASIEKVAHQLSISDPAMLRPGAATLGWYCGHEGADVQEEIRSFVFDVVQVLGIKRLIFIGGSGGGYAALLNSWHFEGSLAIAVSPQTNLKNYYSGHIKNYLESCWSSCSSLEDIPTHVVTDLLQLYGYGYTNSVVCLASQGDTFHLQRHILPFVNLLASQKKPRFVFECNYWGIPKHSRSVPPEVFGTWLKASVTAPTFDTEQIIEHHHRIKTATKIKLQNNEKGPEKLTLFASEDIHLADILRAHALRLPGKK